MGKQMHIIQKLTVEIGLPSQEEAFAIQSKISNNYERLMLGTISEIFDRLVGENEVVRIDKLEINLGTLSSQYLENELPHKIREEMEEALQKLLIEVRQSPGGTAEVRMKTDGGDTLIVQANVQQKSFSLFETLVYFLEYGVLPWTDDQKEKPTLRFLVAQAMEKHPDQLRRALQQMRNKQYVFRRLAFQLPEEQLQYLAAILGSGFSSKLVVFFKDIQKWVELILKRSKSKMPAENAISVEKMKFFFWEETLAYFSSGADSRNISGGAPDEIFISELLEKTILRFRIKISAESIKRVKGNFENTLAVALKNLLEKTIENELLHEKKVPEKKGEVLIQELKVEFPETPEAEEGIYIDNAGLVILAPYIPAFFRNLGLISGKDFVNEDAKWKGVHLLQWLVFADRKKEEENTEATEHDLILNKIFCGIDMAEPIPVAIELSEKEKEEGIDLLKAIIENWTIIKRSSVHGLQVTFLVKEGKLKRLDKDWSLFIHRDSGVDMLIDKLPWGISMIKFPWNKETIYVEW